MTKNKRPQLLKNYLKKFSALSAAKKKTAVDQPVLKSANPFSKILSNQAERKIFDYEDQFLRLMVSSKRERERQNLPVEGRKEQFRFSLNSEQQFGDS